MDFLTTSRIKIFADGADLAGMQEMYRKPHIRGFTTNPTLMHNVGIRDYQKFALEVLAEIPDRPISFEVFSDEITEMKRQAMQIAGWGDTVYVKIPVSNTRREPTYELIRDLSKSGVRLNITAIMSLGRCATSVRPSPEAPRGRFGLRRADRRYRTRSDTSDGRGPGASPAVSERRTALGQSARTAQPGSGGVDRLPRHHDDERPAEEASAYRQGSGRLFARHREDVPQ